ncbi:MAG: GTPase Era [Oscillospiraceae bacterium]|nr:GTPase Era [Oscillospiraceae bacterium]MCR5305116.1 GTPase Era [Oscillospiraceae bacterium]
MEHSADKSRILFAAIAGHTNAGKSSLLNAVIGERIASVSPKPQTTRTRITGIRNIGDTQLVFTDTPGLHTARTKLGDRMLKAAKDAVSDIDCVIFMQDCTKPLGDQELTMLSNLTKQGTSLIFVYNKIDLLSDKTKLAPLLAAAYEKWHPAAIIPMSVTKNEGISDLTDELLKLAVPGPHYFPDDMLTDQPERVLAAEIVREQLLWLLNDEVPHGIAVVTEQFREREDKDLLDVSVLIYCDRQSHKSIIIGKNGEMLKKAATAARKRLEEFFRIQVNLKTWVKVKEDWRNRDAAIRNFGLEEQ